MIHALAVVQVNLFQKHLFLHQLTHNMTKDCSWNYHEQSFVILWVSWCKNKFFWKRFTCIRHYRIDYKNDFAERSLLVINSWHSWSCKQMCRKYVTMYLFFLKNQFQNILFRNWDTVLISNTTKALSQWHHLSIIT